MRGSIDRCMLRLLHLLPRNLHQLPDLLRWQPCTLSTSAMPTSGTCLLGGELSATLVTSPMYPQSNSLLHAPKLGRWFAVSRPVAGHIVESILGEEVACPVLGDAVARREHWQQWLFILAFQVCLDSIFSCEWEQLGGRIDRRSWGGFDIHCPALERWFFISRFRGFRGGGADMGRRFSRSFVHHRRRLRQRLSGRPAALHGRLDLAEIPRQAASALRAMRGG